MTPTEQERRNAIYRLTRGIKRRAALGMKVQYGRTVNPSVGIVIEHFELSVPGYELTCNGPEIIDIDDLEIDE